MQRKLLDVMKPAVNFCRIFSMGLGYRNVTGYFVDASFALINVLVFLYGYYRVTDFVAQKMPEIWDINAVVSVVRLYTRLSLPPLMVFHSQFKKIALNAVLGQLDVLVPTISYHYLRSFMWYSCAWLMVSIFGEMLALTTFHMRTSFRHFEIVDYLLIAVFNSWTYIPILQYLFVIKTANLGVRTINERIVTFAEWKTSRAGWKELRYLAVYYTNKEVGTMIIAHLVCKIMDIIFFTFISYFYGYKEGNEIVALMLVVSVSIMALWTFELIRQCQNCKSEVS